MNSLVGICLQLIPALHPWMQNRQSASKQLIVPIRQAFMAELLTWLFQLRFQ